MKRRKEELEKIRTEYECELLVIESKNEDYFSGLKIFTDVDDNQTVDIEQLKLKVEDLEGQLFHIKSERGFKKVLLEKLLSGNALKEIFNSDQNDDLYKLIKNYCEERDRLSKDILLKQDELDTLRRKTDELKVESIELQESNKVLFAQYKNVKDEFDRIPCEEETKKKIGELKAEMKEKLTEINIIRDVFQNLIFQTQCEWAENDELRELVLKLGEPLTDDTVL